MASFATRLGAALIGGAWLLSASLPALADPFDIVLENGVVTPNRIEIEAGSMVTLRITNKGRSVAEFESKVLHIEKIVAPGASITVTLRNLAPGSYGFVDEFTEDLQTAHGVIIAR